MQYVAVAESVDEDPLPGGLIVAHYRIDAGQRVIRALAWGALVIVIGMFVVAGGIYASRAISPLRVDAAPPPPRGVRFAGGPVDADGNPIDRSDELFVQLLFGAIGLATVVAGGGIVLLSLKRELDREVYLALRTDGAVFRDGRHVAGVRWEDVEEVRWDEAEGAVWFVAHDGAVWARPERFTGIQGPELAKRASEVRRKALFGLYG